MTPFLLFALFCTLNAVSAESIEQRSVEFFANPNCVDGECTSDNTSDELSPNQLLYARSTGQQDIVHILYSTIGSFTVLMFKTNVTTTLSIDWQMLVNSTDINPPTGRIQSAIEFSEPPVSMSGWSFPTIIEFDDASASADLTNATRIVEHSTGGGRSWTLAATSNTSYVFETPAAFTTTDQNDTDEAKFKFCIQYTGTRQRDTQLPRLLLTPTSSSLELVIDSVPTHFNRSKFAFTTIFLTSAVPAGNVSLTETDSNDDEYAPGTFKLFDVRVARPPFQSFLQWRPIFYYSSPKTLENSTITKHYPLGESGARVPLGIARFFFEETDKCRALNVSFGVAGDEKTGYFYGQHNYSTWTFVLGLGEPSVDTMSPIVYSIILIGLHTTFSSPPLLAGKVTRI